MTGPDARRRDPAFRSFLRQRGQHVLRYTYLLTGSSTAARDLAIRTLVELGTRWGSLIREHGEPERAVLVLAARRYLAGESAPWRERAVSGTGKATGPEPVQLSIVEIAASRPLAVELGGAAEHERLDAHWSALRELPGAERTDLVLRHWAELDAATLNQLRGRQVRRWRRVFADEAPPPAAASPLPPETLTQVFRHAERSAPDLDPDLIAAVESAAGTERVRRHGRGWIGAAAAVAVLATVVGIQSTRPDAAPRTTPQAALSWNEAWSDVRIRDFDAELSDGSRYEPLRFVNLTLVLAATPALSTNPSLLLVDTESRTARRLGPLPPGPVRVVTAADTEYVAWVLQGEGPGGDQIWTASIYGGPPKLAATMPLAASSAVPVMGLGRGRVWVVTTRPRSVSDVVIETYSAPIGGGPVRTEASLANLWPISWPWFGTVVRPPQRDVVIRNAVTGERRRGRIPLDTTGVCGPSWCLGQGLNADDSTTDDRTYIGPLNGRWRQRVQLERVEGGTTTTPVLADRFVLTRSPDASGTQLFDILKRREVRIPGSVQRVSDSGTVLGWWDNSVRRTRWRVVDLASIP